MSNPPVTRNVRTIITEVGLWAQEQPWHPNHAPDYGVVEEVGELVHCVLKHLQKIRGFEDRTHFEREAKDALGDALIYLSHWCYRCGCFYMMAPHKYAPSDVPFRQRLAELLIHCNKILVVSALQNPSSEVCNTVATGFVNTLERIAGDFGWDLYEDCLYPTWHKVKMRNWNKDKQNGGETPKGAVPSFSEPERPCGDWKNTSASFSAGGPSEY